MNSRKILTIFLLILAPIRLMAGENTAIQKPNLDNGVALHGYDPVSYFEQKPIEGKKEFLFKTESKVYHFATSKNLETFKKEPMKYEPQYGGWCSYAMASNDFVDIDPLTYKITDGKLYLFYNGIWGNTLKKWNKDEVSLYKKAEENWSKLHK